MIKMLTKTIWHFIIKLDWEVKGQGQWFAHNSNNSPALCI